MSCALLVGLTASARAQDPGALTRLQASVAEAIDTLVVLSAGPGLDGARYHVDEDRLELGKLEFTLPLPWGAGRPLGTDEPPPLPERPNRGEDGGAGEDEGAPPPHLLTPFISARVGYAFVEDHAGDPADEARLQGGHLNLSVAGAGAGIGLRVQLTPWLRLEPRADLIHSRVTSRPGGDNPGRTLLRSLPRGFAGWRAETLTTLAQLGISGRIPLGPLLVRPRVTLAYLHTDTYSTTTDLQRTHEWSTVVVSGLDLELPVFGLAPLGYPLVFVVGLTHTHFEGAVGRAFGYRELFGVPTALLLDVSREGQAWVSRVGVSGEYLRARGLEGWTATLAWEVGF